MQAGAGGAEAAMLDALAAGGRLAAADRARVLALAEARGEPAARLLSRLGLVAEDAIAAAWGAALGLPVLAGETLATADPLPGDAARGFLARAGLLPLTLAGGTRVLAMADPADEAAAAAADFALGETLPRAVAPRSALAAMVSALPDPEARPAAPHAAAVVDVERLRDLASDAPVVQWVNGAIDAAIAEGASDIHFEPEGAALSVRHRIDGTLRPAAAPPPALREAVLSRVKIMARLDIAERRLPQDGRATVTHRGRTVDLRIATAPTPDGETLVIRILDPERSAGDLAALGFAPGAEAAIRRLIARPNGIVLVTGPTGSGKTTTLYAMLRGLASGERKLISVEDPVEYAVPGVAQIQAQPAIGLDFARALRAILRHDPDVVMVGEIRDRETAEVAVEAALTGHLVLSTLHTNSAPATVTRLLEMGIAPFLLASALGGVVAQRLLGRLCPDCAVPMPDAAAVAARLGLPEGARPRTAPGCPRCRGRGVRGRVAAAEVLEIGAAERSVIHAGAAEGALAAAMAGTGLPRLAEDALAKAAAGEVGVAEALALAPPAPAPRGPSR
jgi:general secretion pathway protein E